MSTKHKVEIVFEVGTIEELGFGGFKVNWVSAEHDGQELALNSGAGCGNPLLEASITDGSDHLYAQANISRAAYQIFAILQKEMAAKKESDHEKEQRGLAGATDPGEH